MRPGNPDRFDSRTLERSPWLVPFVPPRSVCGGAIGLWRRDRGRVAAGRGGVARSRGQGRNRENSLMDGASGPSFQVLPSPYGKLLERQQILTCHMM
jgi:hypothetical protein